MKRILVIALFFCGLAVAVQGQGAKPKLSTTEKLWRDTIDATSQEDWSTAYRLCTDYLKQVTVEDQDKHLPAPALFIYMWPRECLPAVN